MGPYGVSKETAHRYSRQLLVPEVGVQGQDLIQATSILIVGAGGLGSPAALYLAGAGVRKIGLMDGDCVEVSNLHRQVMHSESRVGESKAESGAKACLALNPSAQVQAYSRFLQAEGAREIVREYDVVLDASDNVDTRYLINDACILESKPLVSGSALRLEGQLTVYNYLGGPCYRCIFPTPPPQDTVTSCSDGGVLGPVPGVIGTLQAMEALKIAMKKGEDEVMSGRMLMYDAMSCKFRNIKLRGRNSQCAVCGENPQITEAKSVTGLGPGQCAYELKDPCPAAPQLEEEHHASCSQLAARISDGANIVVIDVREPLQYEICKLPGTHNFPLAKLEENLPEVAAKCRGSDEVFVICRRGIDSKTAARLLLKAAHEGKLGSEGALPQRKVRHVTGGLTKWAEEVDTEFPKY